MTTAAQYREQGARQVLANGSWIRGAGGVQTYVTAQQLPAPEPAPRKVYDLTQLIACTTCRAKVTESCRVVDGATKGQPRSPHWGRLAPRLCPCGLLPSSKTARLCTSCARESLRTSKREHMRRKRAAA